MNDLFTLFTDPVLRAPTIGAMLVGIASGLMGTVAFLRKQTLIGEVLSHAAYPGVGLALAVTGFFALGRALSIFIALGAFLACSLGFWLCSFLQKKLRVPHDASLCFILSLFFGVGILFSSFIQYVYPQLYSQARNYLYGQSATMGDAHLVIYGILTVIIIGVVILFYKEIQTLSFDDQYARAAQTHSWGIEALIFFLTVITIVTGIRSVGVILMSAMIITPAATARQFTNRLSVMFFLAALFGMLSGYIGTYLSFSLSRSHFSLPTGPLIVLVASSFAFYALLFSTKKGLLVRFFRMVRFRSLTVRENLLKIIWRMQQQQKPEGVLFSQLCHSQGFSKLYLKYLLLRLQIQGWITRKNGNYVLTHGGFKKGGQIVRLHRLWEVYLVNSLGLNVERVHKSAEEMEHILTPDLEKRLTELLDNPERDPHAQPIPPQKEVMTHGT